MQVTPKLMWRVRSVEAQMGMRCPCFCVMGVMQGITLAAFP
jgi:hypothetical protein